MVRLSTIYKNGLVALLSGMFGLLAAASGYAATVPLFYQNNMQRAQLKAGHHPVSMNAAVARVKKGDRIRLAGPNGGQYSYLVEHVLPTRDGVYVSAYSEEIADHLRFVFAPGKGVYGRVGIGSDSLKLSGAGSSAKMVSMRDVGASPLARLDDMRAAPASQSSGSQVPAAQMQPLNAEPEGAVSRISLLVLYEPSIPQIGQLVDYLVNYTNEVYSQSQINLEFNVVGTEEYSLPVISDGQALDDITFNETVDAWRDQYSADMVTFLRPYNRADGDCGIAWIIGANGSSFSSFSLQNYTTSVVNVGEDGSFFCDDLTLAHELGHNLGAAHDRGNSGSLAPYYPYGYGFGVSGVFGTVMSYQSPSVGYFSNPSLATCNGELCGEADSSDVARAINNVRQLYADIYDNPDLSLPPDPPDIDSFTATLSSISLNFSPNGEGSGAITGYTGSCGAFTATGDQTALTLQGLAPGTLYSCTVAAENEFGMGAASAPVDAATLPLPPVIVAIEPEDGGLLVRLQPDNASGDAPAAAYRVTCGEITVSSTYSAVVVTGLQNGESYSCSGAIENAAGWSEISLQVSGVPLEAVPTGLSMPLLKAMIDSRQ